MASVCYPISGKVALVTGGARGIGFAAAHPLSARGTRVAVVDIDAEKANEAPSRIGQEAVGIGADVSDVDAIGDRRRRRESTTHDRCR
jgi:NAD(P)-dependent dehydrogenase (short-subunit alcohol dehydrogenase family)